MRRHDTSFTGTVVAHRGRAYGHPENSIASLTRLPTNVSAIEIDVRLTCDRIAVLMHDDSVDRTTSRSGQLAEKTYRELVETIAPAGTPPPRLTSYLDVCAERGLELILIDVKSADRHVLEAVTEDVSASAVATVCVVMVRSEDQLALARETIGELRLGSFGTTVANAGTRIAAAQRHGAELLLIHHGDNAYLENRSVVAQIKRAGLIAGASTVNSTEALTAAQIDRCDLILTDRSESFLPVNA